MSQDDIGPVVDEPQGCSVGLTQPGQLLKVAAEGLLELGLFRTVFTAGVFISLDEPGAAGKACLVTTSGMMSDGREHDKSVRAMVAHLRKQADTIERAIDARERAEREARS